MSDPQQQSSSDASVVHEEPRLQPWKILIGPQASQDCSADLDDPLEDEQAENTVLRLDWESCGGIRGGKGGSGH